MKSSKNKINTKTQYNRLPKIIFIPFKTSKGISVFFLILSLIVSVYILYNVISGTYTFSQDELKDFADFTLNIVLIIAALGFTIFTLPISKVHPEKDKILFSYIGQIFVMVSIIIFTYILSFCNLLPGIIYGLYFCLMFFALCSCIIKLLSVIIGYFNIKD